MRLERRTINNMTHIAIIYEGKEIVIPAEWLAERFAELEDMLMECGALVELGPLPFGGEADTLVFNLLSGKSETN